MVHPWRPLTLQGSLLWTMACTSLCWGCRHWTSLPENGEKDGYIMLVSKTESHVHFISRHPISLPSITSSVFYGMILNWIDLYVKRLEPFFQLSKPGGGATAQGSPPARIYGGLPWGCTNQGYSSQVSISFLDHFSFANT